MISGKRTLQILSTSLPILLLTSVASAGTISFTTTEFVGTTSMGLPSTATCVGQVASMGLTCAPGTDPVAQSGNSLTFDFSSFNGQVFVEDPNGPNTLQDNFQNGTALLATEVGGTTLTIHFANNVSAFGFFVQETDFTNNLFTATVNVNGGSSCSGIVGGCSTSSTATGGDPLFLGLQTSGAASISSITITTSSTGSGSGNFVIGDASFDNGTSAAPPAPGPEPSTFAMIGGGLLALGWKARKRVRA